MTKLSNDAMNDAKSDACAVFFETIERAIATFSNIKALETASIEFDLKGVCAGQALLTHVHGIIPKYYIRLNTQIFELGTKKEIHDTIIHEVAHLVCYANRRLGSNHDKGWKRVCRILGGDDSRTHTINLSRARKVTITRHIYIINGESFKFTNHQHKRLQGGGCRVNGHLVQADDFSETIKIVKV